MQVIMGIREKFLLISLFIVQAKSQGCISSDVINISSICSISDRKFVYNYTTLEQFHQFVTELTSVFEYLEPKFDVGNLCYFPIQVYMCDYFFPRCVGNNPQAICKASCNNYLHNGVCANNFTYLLNYLNTTNSTIVQNFNTNCSELQSEDSGCNRLIGIPYNNGTVECNPVPVGDVFCKTTFGYSHYSIPVTAQFDPHVARISMLSSNASISQECTNFFAFYQCLATYTPCNATSMKIFAFCEDSCNTVSNLILKCLDFTDIDPRLWRYFLQFNCSNPLTYTPSLTLEYYEPPNDAICNAYRVYLANDDESTSLDDSNTLSGGLSGGQIAGIVIGTLIAIVIIIIIIIVVLRMSTIQEHHIFLKQDNMFTINPQYSASLKTKPVAREDDLASTINDAPMSPSTDITYVDDVENMITSYQEKLAPLLIKTSDFVLNEEIGQGAFGKVFKGVLTTSDGSDLVVAIKTIKTTEWSSEDIKSFLLECSKMSELHHPNVLELVGICFDGNTPYMLLPYMANGDLKEFLLSRRVSEEDVTVYPKDLDENIFLEMILDIAKGMEYLASLYFIHRDLAARNCMVDDNLQVKIADFGLSRDVYESNYYVLRHSAKLPVRWMALESLLDGRFSIKTDLWSYGVTCWEIFSLGRQPYPGISHAEILDYLSSGHRLARPHLCPAPLYTIITACWELKSDDRPTFAELVIKIDKFKQLKANNEQMDPENECYVNVTIAT